MRTKDLEHRQRRNAQIAVFLCAAILIAVALGADAIRLSTRSGLGPMQLALAAVAITLFVGGWLLGRLPLSIALPAGKALLGLSATIVAALTVECLLRVAEHSVTSEEKSLHAPIHLKTHACDEHPGMSRMCIECDKRNGKVTRKDE